MNNALLVLTLTTCLGTALMAGVFFAFSVLVMKAFGRLSPATGMLAMQAVNASAISSLFLIVLLGTAASSVALTVTAVVLHAEPFAGWLLAGAGCYLVGSIGLTMTYHVPRNDALAVLTPESEDAARRWGHYLSRWTFWNHVRTVSSLAATTSLIVAINVS